MGTGLPNVQRTVSHRPKNPEFIDLAGCDLMTDEISEFPEGEDNFIQTIDYVL